MLRVLSLETQSDSSLNVGSLIPVRAEVSGSISGPFSSQKVKVPFTWLAVTLRDGRRTV